MKEDKVWMSICGKHHDRNPDCSMCQNGYWITRKELDEEHELFTNDYAEWYRQNNNGLEPDESAWSIWHFITRRKK